MIKSQMTFGQEPLSERAHLLSTDLLTMLFMLEQGHKFLLSPLSNGNVKAIGHDDISSVIPEITLYMAQLNEIRLMYPEKPMVFEQMLHLL